MDCKLEGRERERGREVFVVVCTYEIKADQTRMEADEITLMAP